MKTYSSRQQREGSVLLVTLAITAVLGFALASYLTLIGTQNRSVARSQNWNSSIPVSEAGVEEAIVHLNKNCLYSDVTHAPVDWTADGWTPTSDGNGITKTRTLGEGYYVVTIITNSPYSTNGPGIFSKGFVPATVASAPAETMFAAIGTPTVGATYVGRQVRVTTGKDGFMTRAMVAKDSIDLNGNNIETDSFDSSDPAYSSNGLYDSSKRKSHGDVAVNKGVVNTLSIGNANIYGSVAVGPNGSISIGSNGKVGDAGWMADSSKSGIQPGHSRDDMNVSFPDVTVPFETGNANPSMNLWVTNDVIAVTNISTTSLSYPTGAGTVNTNTTPQTTSSYPVAGTYIGSVITNLSSVTSASYPSSGTYVGVVATNTTSVTSTSYPSSGTYVGSVVTNLQSYNTSYFPSDPYGPVRTNYNGSGKKIMGYSYNKIAGYTYEKLAGYSVSQISGYTVAHVTGYTLVQSFYTTNKVPEFYDYVFDDGNYKVTSLSGRVLIRSNATIYVTEDVNASDGIQINPDASLKLYMAGPSFSVSGNGIVNATGKAENFWYFGLPSNTSISLGGNAAFTGAIYAPQAAFQMNGGGNNTWDFIGATLTKTVKMNGHFNFHYDEALSKTGPSRGYIISGWDEISISENYTNNYSP